MLVHGVVYKYRKYVLVVYIERKVEEAVLGVCVVKKLYLSTWCATAV